MRQRPAASVVAAAKAPVGPPPNGISIGQLSPIAQQLALAEHDRLETALPAGSAGPASNDQDSPPSLDTSTELVFGAPVLGTGTDIQYDGLTHESASMAPPRAGTRAADQVDPASALKAAAIVLVVPAKPVDTHCPLAKHWTCKGTNVGRQLGHGPRPPAVSREQGKRWHCRPNAVGDDYARRRRGARHVGAALPEQCARCERWHDNGDVYRAWGSGRGPGPAAVISLGHEPREVRRPGSSLALRTTQVLGLVHCTPLVGWPGSAS